jgi:cyanophycinase-like exopeptidase
VTAEGYLGLGIDESTAVVWTLGGGWVAAGRGVVSVLAADGARRYEDGDAVEAVPAPGRP